ncbi:hypothetical protein NKR19_g7199 [Coniochaeta hoffmannii]|uniref:Uncharacterized protein n=1 Tax=Coniochaeta hoffmannii TaxID=91930 RepID=A0AA38VN38_9PEZI|nr:hypothetical protein NKR19_g7199 [Coniochaeta hoffmannii]
MKKVLGPASAVEDGMNPAGPSAAPSATASQNAAPSNLVQQDSKSTVNQTVVDPPRQRKSQFHPVFTEISQVLVPSITVGAGAGATGVLVGAVSGIWRAESVISFSTVTAIQWFTLGSSYYGARQVAFKAYGGHENMTALDKIKASGIAGGFAGAMGGLLRGPKNVLPGFIVWSVLGAGGQAVGGALSGRNFGTRYLASRWSPVTPLTDRQYEKMLEEKLLKLDAEIAIINDNIEEIRKRAK